MSHMVIYRGADGKPGYHQTDDIHDAVGFVERMRNDESVEQARIFRLEEVVFEYKPYYRVELQPAIGSGDDALEIDAAKNDNKELANSSSANGNSASGSVVDVNSESTSVSDEAEVVANGAKKGLFGR